MGLHLKIYFGMKYLTFVFIFMVLYYFRESILSLAVASDLLFAVCGFISSSLVFHCLLITKNFYFYFFSFLQTLHYSVHQSPSFPFLWIFCIFGSVRMSAFGTLWYSRGELFNDLIMTCIHILINVSLKAM